MRANIVFTLTGKDRVGLVEEVTKFLLDLGGNVETSRMARLGGEFAILVLVSLPAERLPDLEDNVHTLTAQGFKVTTSETEAIAAQPGGQAYRIEVLGADHEGIVHNIAHALAQRGINIESMETGTTQAPHSGTPLFTLDALVSVPPNLPGEDWEAALEETGHRLNVEVKVTAAKSN